MLRYFNFQISEHSNIRTIIQRPTNGVEHSTRRLEQNMSAPPYSERTDKLNPYLQKKSQGQIAFKAIRKSIN